MNRAALEFFKQLKSNNTREWFHAHRPEYEAALADFTGHVATLIQGARKISSELGPLTPKDAIFRIYRDVRFAKDKTPYKPHFGAFIAPGGRKGNRAGYYVHVEPGGESMIAGGIYMPPGPELLKIRTAIAANSAPLRKILKAAKFKRSFGDFAGERLKTIPRGFSKDHPDQDLLKLKSFIVSRKLTDAQMLKNDLAKTTLADFKLLAPLNAYLNEALGS
ncbi:MAG: DUF2461 domain-containing protein [Leptospirales bacterium]|jgi:uncharacterized protein (TIGR02453 family)